FHREMLTAVLTDGPHEPPEQLEQWVSFRVHLVAALDEELDPGEHQKRTEDVNHPVEALEERRAEHDENRAHDERTQDPPEQDPVLVLTRNRECREDDDEDEDIVDRQRLLDQITREE